MAAMPREPPKPFGDGPLSTYERPPSLRALDLSLAVLLVGLLAYTGYKGYWEVFVLVLAVAVITARRDMILGFRPPSPND